MADLNVCAGIDAGSSESKLAYADELGTRIIARLEGFDLRALREECEAFFDEPVFSCVVAGGSRVRADNSGFSDVNVIAQSEAAILGLGRETRNIVCDLGESACRVYVIDGHELTDTETVNDVCGRVFNKNFADYLSERYRLIVKDNNILHEAKRIKHSLTELEIASWHGREIYRYELERVIHFAVKRAARVIQRLVKVHKPEGLILTGGSVKIPEVWRVIAEVSGMTPEYRGSLIAEGAAARARELQRVSRAAKSPDTGARLRELRADVIAIEDKLNRKQKDRVYALFRQSEGINDPGIITLMENLIREIKNV